MKLSITAGFYLFLQITTLYVNVYGRCPGNADTLPSVPHGHKTNVGAVRIYSDGTVDGYYDIKCDSGYALNSAIGERITCLESGSWSQPLPECKSMGFCPISQLFDFISSTSGIQVVESKRFVYTNGVDDNLALGGSNITLNCLEDYKNVGGPLTIICTEANTWTTFPHCVPTVARCPVTDDTWTFDNGYMSNADDILVYPDNTASGTATVSCNSGYAMDSTSEGVFKCDDGTWSSRPYCTKTARCSHSALTDFTNDPSLTEGLDIASQSLFTENDDDEAILENSYVEFTCKDGYTLADGDLTVTCNADGEWSAFPSCTSES